MNLVIISRPDIIRYYIHPDNNNNRSKTSAELWTHEDTPYLARKDEIWGVFCEFVAKRG